MRYFLFTLFSALTIVTSFAQESIFKLQGTITNSDGIPLPYATVYIKEAGTGAVANDVGHYEVNLKPGNYNLVYQFMGFESVEKAVKIVDKDVYQDIELPSQTVMLRDVIVTGKDEDPAYAVIRKAIAKAKYHKNQVDSFSANVYIKGKGRLLKAPFLVRRKLKKEGIDSTKVFLSETYSSIQYKRPNTVKEKVLSVRKIGPQEATPPMEFITGNVYDPLVGDVVSPLSPKAFAYYRFEYLGTFKDKDYEVSKIRIIPRVKDEYVVEGVINIVEDYFNVHSLDIKLVKSGINVDIQQIYEPIQDNVWMPVTHKFFIHGKFMGFKFEYTYLASVSDYNIIVNPDLPQEFTVIDEKTEIADEPKDTVKAVMPGEAVKKENKKKVTDIQDKLKEGEEVTTEELKKVLKNYEKEEKQQMDEPFLMFNKDFSIDSMAYKRDSSYWNDLRPIPLNEEEEEGYQWLDSLAEVNKNKELGDTLTSKDRDKFKPLHLITGARYKVGEKAHLEISTIGAEFNTVEGLNLETSLAYTKTFEHREWLKIKPVFRYGFSSKDFYSYLDTEYGFGERLRRNTFRLKGGKYIYQFNSNNPIYPTVNSFTTLFLEENYMKLYEKEFVDFDFTKNIREDLKFQIGADYSKRSQLFNSSDFKLINDKDKTFDNNAPENVELGTVNFPAHEAFVFNTFLEYKPGLRFGARNGQIFEFGTKVPTFKLNYTAGLSGIAGSAKFHHLNLSGDKQFAVIRNTIDAKLETGTFLGTTPDYFMDFQHFMGNETIFAPGKGLGKYRLLDYYRFSTSKEYLSGFAQYNPSKLLLSQIRKVRLSGFREYLFANYLYTPDLKNYVETGIAFDNIFRVFKVEAVTSFVNGKYQDFGIRVGLASFIGFDGRTMTMQF